MLSEDCRFKSHLVGCIVLSKHQQSSAPLRAPTASQGLGLIFCMNTAHYSPFFYVFLLHTFTTGKVKFCSRKKKITSMVKSGLQERFLCLVGEAVLNHLPNLSWKKTYSTSRGSGLCIASSQSLRTTGCIQGSRENKHCGMSFLHTWCFSQPQIPKFVRCKTDSLQTNLNFYLIRVYCIRAYVSVCT